MFLAIVVNPPSIVKLEGPMPQENIVDVEGIMVSQPELNLIKEQFANIPINTMRHDNHVWYGNDAKFILANYVWNIEEEVTSDKVV